MGKRFGAMLDMSRNAVMTVETVKKYADYLKSFGYNCLLLYTEDTYEVNNEPFFGYRRGKYSKEELKLLNEYCDSIGIELIPCIQTLAHLNALFRWKDYANLNDIDDILLVDEDRTYTLIENIFSTLSECFKTRCVHIGMDEAWHLGLGKYLEQHGYHTRFEILSKHLNKVVNIAKKYGFTCIMWSDMFFNQATGAGYYDYEKFKIDDRVKSLVNKDVELIYWDYYHTEKTDYSAMVEAHKKLTDNPVWFAGGAWSWVGFAPHNEYSLKTMLPAMQICREKNIDNVFITLWGDNGAECSKFSLLPALYRIKCEYDGITDEQLVKSNFYKLTGENYDDFFALDLPDKLSDKCDYLSNPCKYILYGDLFNEVFSDGYIEGGEKTFLKNAEILKNAKSKNFNYLFKTLYKLCLALSVKYTLGKDIRTAYTKDDKSALLSCIKRISNLKIKINDFYRSFCHQWFKENKPHGFDVQDIRIGGLIYRLDACKKRLQNYVNGKISSIPELEEELLPIYHKNEKKDNIGFINGWSVNATVNII